VGPREGGDLIAKSTKNGLFITGAQSMINPLLYIARDEMAKWFVRERNLELSSIDAILAQPFAKSAVDAYASLNELLPIGWTVSDGF
jgi:hypothetical protein